MAEIDPDLTLKASYDSRFDYKKHFIINDISRRFLDKNGLNNVAVNDFKARVRKAKPAFHAKAGNPKFSTGYRNIKVYDINDFKN